MIRNHRPIPFPAGNWVMKQIWQDLLFAHWTVREEEIAPHIPDKLQLEYWEGTPWITLSPFWVRGLRLRGLPPIPFTSRFLELNVRTYVTYKGVPGIYFLSLDASNRIAVETARLFHLPYLNAKMKVIKDGLSIRYSSGRIDRRGKPESVK